MNIFLYFLDFQILVKYGNIIYSTNSEVIMHFKTIFKSLKNKDMLKRVLIILGIIVAYRILAQIPVPMGDASTFKEAVSNLLEKSDFSSFLNLISGGGLASFSIILVGLSPYITGSIVIQLLTKAIPSLEELSNDGETGRRKINQWTRILTVPLAIIQSVAYIFILYQSTISANISQEELEQRIRATVYKNWGPSLKLHNHTFKLVPYE